MVKIKILIFIVIFLCLSGTTFCQKGSKFGIGIALIDLEKLSELNLNNGVGTHTTITIPIIFSQGFRIEPEAGYFRIASESKMGSITSEDILTSYRTGIGLFLQKEYEDFTLYYGGRFGFIEHKVTRNNGNGEEEESTNGNYLAPTLGGEYNFSDHCSIGAEAQIVYAPMQKINGNGSLDVSISLWETRGLVFFRFYF